LSSVLSPETAKRLSRAKSERKSRRMNALCGDRSLSFYRRSCSTGGGPGGKSMSSVRRFQDRGKSNAPSL
jgi:hypothetical protein